MVSLSRRGSSVGWRFPTRADSLSKPSHHHIVHASMQEGIDKLNAYLRDEMERDTSRTDSIIALYTSGESSPTARGSNDSKRSMSTEDAALLDTVSGLLPETPSWTGAADEVVRERDELQRLLDECITKTEHLAREHAGERDDLRAELQGMQGDYGQLLDEHRHALARAGELAAENARLEQLVQTLRGDVAVAEQRNERIKEHARETVDRANAEIGRLHAQLTQAQRGAAAMQARAAKTESRARALHSKLGPTQIARHSHKN
ncbi:hypothetical protein IWW55_002693 [Coemansia sp. RSA 2706]|nr:hypothetical protein LPJ63_004490 [Coemansia sp. RSA 2711]KAJ2303897.1 hypothetical protein IWW55_002693 [Coemansia sp. RSA 2706]KAJ2326226.1 hypothetical protein IWW51_002390 [Coemansia sp. RSA 2702]